MFQGWWQRQQDREHGRPREFHPSVEALEDRTLLSVALVGDVNPLTQPSFVPTPAHVSSAQVGAWTYFSASDGQHANELWRSNGTGSGTVLVKAIDGPGLTPDAPSTIDHLTALGNQVIFTVDDGIHGDEVWISDGTARGTRLLQDINKGQDIPEGADGASSNARDFVVVGNLVFFTAEDATHGRELWVSDGTPGGTYLVRDIDPFNSVPYSDGPSDLTAFAGRVYFYARDGEHGRELWTSDGSKDGTRMVADLNRGAGDTAPENAFIEGFSDVSGSLMAVMGNRLYFVADNGRSGEELWSTDGSWRGTSQVRDIRAGAQAGSALQAFTTVDGLLYFTADDGIHGRSLWSSDGTSRGTRIVAAPDRPGFADLQDPRQLTAFGHKLAFVTTTTTGAEALWVSDGTTGGTRKLQNIATPDPSAVQIAVVPWPSSQELTVSGGTLYFTAVDAAHGRELWKTDGTTLGTSLVRDIRGQTGSQISLLEAGNRLMFVANDGRTGRELWASDGTGQGTYRVKDINRLPAETPSTPVQLGNKLFFVDDDGVHGAELWVYDLITGQTRLVKDINPTFGPSWNPKGDLEPASSNIHSMTVHNGLLYFMADDGIHGDELWQSDGTRAGTRLVEDVDKPLV